MQNQKLVICPNMIHYSYLSGTVSNIKSIHIWCFSEYLKQQDSAYVFESK